MADEMAMNDSEIFMIKESHQQEIREQENLGDSEDRYRTNYLVRSFLSDWLHRYVKGRWELNRDIYEGEEVLVIRIQRKKDAVLFKLTWGGKWK